MLLLYKEKLSIVTTITKVILYDAGVENKEDIHHLDHEIKELNNSNMKIEEDMMQLQTQVSIYSHSPTLLKSNSFRWLLIV